MEAQEKQSRAHQKEAT